MPTEDEIAERVQRVLEVWRSSYTGFPLVLHDESDQDREDQVRHFSYSDREHDWTVEGWAKVQEGRPVIRSLTIGNANGEEVTAGLVKSVPVGKIAASLQELLVIDDWVDYMRHPGRKDILDRLFSQSGNALSRLVAAIDQTGAPTEGKPPADGQQHRGGRAQLSPELLRQVAEAYLEETAPGQAKKPLGRLAERFDRPEETIRTWVSRARREGWLSQAVKGRAGADPGPRLLAARAEESAS